MKLLLRLIASLLGGALLLGAVPVAGFNAARFFGLAAPVESKPLPKVRLDELAQRSLVLAADGSPIAALFEEDRAPVALEDVPDHVIEAVLAVEDASFFDHKGISVRGMLRALKENASAGGVEQGGSTITQQVVKNELLNGERTVNRKVKEAMLAVQLEEELGKDGILERYLNTVYFGESAYGVHTASERFFGKQLGDITVAEAALLAGLIASPEHYNPFDNAARAEERRAVVLQRMVAEGFLTEEEATLHRAVPLPTQPHWVLPTNDTYFVAEVKRQLLADERLGRTKSERSEKLFRGGLTIKTTFDPRMQQIARQAVDAHSPSPDFTQALVAMDPLSGGVRAVIGGKGFDEQKFNVATQGPRQPGSAFKIVALTAWLDAGNSPEDWVDATAPCEFPVPSGIWKVGNYDGGTGSLSTLRDATYSSSNCAYARLALTLGPERIAEMAQRLGIARKLPAFPSIVLGGEEVTPLEMATVASTLAAEGVRHDPVWVTEIRDADDNVVLKNEPKPQRVLSPEVARAVNSVMLGVVQHGTGKAATIDRPVAGKTGTAQEWTDAWFVGWTPDLATAVWMGSPKGKVPMKGVGGRNVTGGSFPAQIFAAFVGPALQGRPAQQFPPPTALPPAGWVGLPPQHVINWLNLLAGYGVSVAGVPPLPPEVAAPMAPPPPPPTDDSTTTSDSGSTQRPKRSKSDD
jgi:membrane peptidoglycan carboxypeptidase